MTCSTESLELPLLGSAPYARGWLVLESPGTWPARAVEARVTPEVTAWAERRNLNILLARHRDKRTPGNFLRYWVSEPTTGLRVGTRASAEELPDLDSCTPATPLLLICTNGKRDKCCAIEGRNLLTQLEATLSESEYSTIWECTHLGGHRFAPTALYLPDNLVLGRLTIDAAQMLLTTGHIDGQFVRGRSHEIPCLQLINSYLERASQIDTDFPPQECPDSDHSHEIFTDNSHYEFHISLKEFGPARKSCIDEDGMTSHFVVDRVVQSSAEADFN